MENLTIKNKTQGATKYPGQKTKIYAKVEDDIYDLFHERQVRTTYRMLYLALSGNLIPNSEFARANFPKLRHNTGIGSDSTITDGLKELCQKGFLTKMGESTYRMWDGVYKGIREEKINYPDPVEPTTPSVVTPTTPTVVPHVRVLSSKQTIKKQRHGSDDVIFSKLEFKEKSLFSPVSKKSWRFWIAEYGLEKVQDTLDKMERCTKKINKTATGLMNKALKNADVWDFETTEEKELEKKEAHRIVIDNLDESRSQVQKEKRIQDDMDYEQGKKDTYLVNLAHAELKAKSEWYKKNGMYEELLAQKIVRLYGERHG